MGCTLCQVGGKAGRLSAKQWISCWANPAGWCGWLAVLIVADLRRHEPLRGPDFTAPKGEAMADEPAPLFHAKVKRDYAAGFDRVTPRRNAVQGRSRAEYYCRHCRVAIADQSEAIAHAATAIGHVTIEAYAVEFVGVDLDDDPGIWSDGAGVENDSRNYRAQRG